MNKILMCLLFVPLIAQAEAWSLPNRNGGEIVISDRECRYNGKSYAPLRQAYSYWNGGYLEGCWTLEDGMVKIIWKGSDGTADTRVYPLNQFTPKGGAANGRGV